MSKRALMALRAQQGGSPSPAASPKAAPGGKGGKSPRATSRRGGKKKEPQEEEEPKKAVHPNLMTREELIDHTWALLADKGQTRGLTRSQMKQFADLLDFKGTDKEWEDEFAELCTDASVTEADGIKKDAFTTIMNDPYGTCSCSNDELREIAVKLERGIDLVKIVQKKSRPELLYTLYRNLANAEADEIGVLLGKHELARYFEARKMLDQYYKEDAELEDIISMLCAKSGWDVETGVSLGEFVTKINEKNGPGYLTLHQLRDTLEVLHVPVDSFPLEDWKRDDYVLKIFHHCRPTAGEKLDMPGMKRFATLFGFEGTQQQWAAEYFAMCDDQSWDERQGCGVQDFEKLMNDEAHPMYRSVQVLKETVINIVLSELEPENFILDKTVVKIIPKKEEQRKKNKQKRRPTVMMSVGPMKIKASEVGLYREDAAEIIKRIHQPALPRKGPGQNLTDPVAIERALSTRMLKRIQGAQKAQEQSFCQEVWGECKQYSPPLRPGRFSVDMKEDAKEAIEKLTTAHKKQQELELKGRQDAAKVLEMVMAGRPSRSTVSSAVLRDMRMREKAEAKRGTAKGGPQQGSRAKSKDAERGRLATPRGLTQDKVESKASSRSLAMRTASKSNSLSPDRLASSRSSSPRPDREKSHVTKTNSVVSSKSMRTASTGGKSVTRQKSKGGEDAMSPVSSEANSPRSKLERGGDDAGGGEEVADAKKQVKEKFRKATEGPKNLEDLQVELEKIAEEEGYAGFLTMQGFVCLARDVYRLKFKDCPEQLLIDAFKQMNPDLDDKVSVKTITDFLFGDPQRMKRTGSTKSLGTTSGGAETDDSDSESEDYTRPIFELAPLPPLEQVTYEFLRANPSFLLKCINMKNVLYAIHVVKRLTFTGLNQVDIRGCTALHNAAEMDLPSICLELLNRAAFAGANATDCQGWSALHRGARNGAANACRQLLCHPRVTNFDLRCGKAGWNALHLAAMHGHVQTCTVFMTDRRFTGVATRDNWGRTPLQTAMEKGYGEVVHVLLANGRYSKRDVQQCDGFNHTLKDVAHGGETGFAFEVFDKMLRTRGLSSEQIAVAGSS
eukprot:TRINITY_DN91051_c0_g1_i1.p1 TRINITY_DN91051_c0_g1~~TRINITY_DN91051_c0_g1_i1.p1  ORF type:complete len:1071 (+),score=300.02 TRINITY_DN91051_c0_g1_i1:213-3425(+)